MHASRIYSRGLAAASVLLYTLSNQTTLFLAGGDLARVFVSHFEMSLKAEALPVRIYLLELQVRFQHELSTGL